MRALRGNLRGKTEGNLKNRATEHLRDFKIQKKEIL